MKPTLKRLGLDRLTPAERLDLIGELWYSLTPAEAVGLSPDWHREEIGRRISAADADPGAAVPWEVIRARLRGQARACPKLTEPGWPGRLVRV